jgi:hypothetical protein
MKKFIILFTFLLFSSFNLYAQSNFLEIFNRFEMKFDYPIEDIFFEDLNDDNLEDILIQTKASEKKKLLIFFQRRDGFSSSPSQMLDFDEEAIIFDVGNVTNQYQGKEIVYLTSSSLKYYYLEGNFYNPESKKLIDISSIFLSPSPESPVRCKFIWDVNEDKLDDIFVAEPNDLTLFFGEKNGIFKESQKIGLNPFFTTQSPFRFSLEDFEDPEHFSQKIITRVPVLYVDDFNGDKRKDIISIFKDEIKVFFQNEKNEFSKKPDFKINLDILTEKEKKKLLPPAFTVYATDLNDDGLIDIVVSKHEVKAMASLSKIYIHLNKKGKIDLTPDQILMYESAYADPQILDINGDNQKDLIVSEAKMGIFQLLKILITRKLTFENAIYLGQSGKYPELPIAKIKSKLRFNLDKLEESKGEIAYFSGDFNKDGIKDVLKKIDEKNMLAIFLGQSEAKEEIFSKNASYEIKEELPLLIVIKDLNNDKVSDIIFDFRMDDKKKLVVFLSK